MPVSIPPMNKALCQIIIL